MFENNYFVTKNLIKEYVYHILYKKTIIYGYSISLLGLFMFFVSPQPFRYVMLTATLICSITTFFTPIMASKQLEKNTKTLHNGKIEKTRVQFLSNIIMDEGKTHLEFEYNQIKQVLQTKNLIALKISTHSSILILKDGFSKGNKLDFLEFINHKITKQKI